MSDLNLDIDKWMIAWTPARDGHEGAVEVGPWPDRANWSDRYDMTSGCCEAEWSSLTYEEKIDELFRGFFLLVLRDGLEPADVHREFSKIEGYLKYEGRVGLGMGTAKFFSDGRLDPYNP